MTNPVRQRVEILPLLFLSLLETSVDTLVYHGRELSDVLLINFCSRGLHDTVFQDVKRDFLIPSKKALYPGTYPGFVKEMEEVHNRFLSMYSKD